MHELKMWKLSAKEHQLMDQLRRGASMRQACVACDMSRDMGNMLLHRIRVKLEVKTAKEAVSAYIRDIETAYKMTLEQHHDKDIT